MTNYVLVFLISMLAAILHNSISFGYVILFMALTPLFLPARICVMVSQVVGAILSLWIVVELRKDVEMRKVWIPTLLSSIAVLAALRFSVGMADGFLMKCLGVLLLLLGIWMLLFAARVHIRPTAANGVIFGAVSGAMCAFFGVSAPPLVLYYSSVTEDKNHYNACLQMHLLLMGIVSIAGRIGFGLAAAESWLYCIPAFAGAIAGRFPGRWLYGRLNERVFKMVIYIFISVMGVYIFFTN